MWCQFFKRLTSDDKLCSLRDESVPGVECRGCDLTLPHSVVVFQVGVENPQAAVTILQPTVLASSLAFAGPLVFAWVDADRVAVSFPPALSLLVEYDAWHHQ